MNDPRREKIKELKNQIILEQSALETMVNSLSEPMEEGLDEDQKKSKMQEFGKDLALKRANLQALTEELKLVRMNKTGSGFFEWHPHKGFNRRQARLFKRMNRK